jgi:putative restriction endonuclease
MGKTWTEHELLIAMNLYCHLPFGQFDQSNKHIRVVAEKMDRTPGSLSMKLCNLASLDNYHQSRGVVGLKGASNLDKKVWNSFQGNWSIMAEKSEAAFETLMLDAAPPETVEKKRTPEGPSESERTVKVRRLQKFFRSTVLANYENKCALTGISVPQLLIASHIIPWSESEDRRADPTNGLCLNALHDKAFDRHLITFDENYKLMVSSLLKKGHVSEFQRSNFTKLEGLPLVLPHRFAPDLQALEVHRNSFVP